VPDLKRLDRGARLHGCLLVVEMDHRSYGNGKDCVVLTLGNASGRIASAPFWSERRAAIAGLAPGSPVEVTGEISLYRGRRQLEVLAIRPLSRDDVDWRRLVPSANDVAPYWRALDRWRSDIRAPRRSETRHRRRAAARYRQAGGVRVGRPVTSRSAC
jgi:hypothetical protein